MIVDPGCVQPGFSILIFLEEKIITRITDSVAPMAWEGAVTEVTQIPNQGS